MLKNYHLEYKLNWEQNVKKICKMSTSSRKFVKKLSLLCAWKTKHTHWYWIYPPLLSLIGQQHINICTYKDFATVRYGFNVYINVDHFFYFSGIFSRPFTIHRTAGEGEDYFLNFSIPFPPAS